MNSSNLNSKSKYFCFVVLLLFFAFNRLQSAETVDPGKIKAIIDTTKDIGAKFWGYHNLFQYYKNIDSVEAYSFLEEIRKLAEELNRQDWKLNYFKLMNKLEIDYSNFNIASKHNQQAIKYLKSENDTVLLIQAYHDFASVCMHWNYYLEAAMYFDSTIQLKENFGLNYNREIYLKGYSKVKSGNYELALEDFFTNLYNNKEIGNHDTVRPLSAIAYTYSKIGEYGKADEYFSRAEQAILASDYSKKAYTYAEILNDKSNMYLQMSRYEEALNIIDASIRKWEKIRKSKGLVDTSKDLGEVSALVVRSRILEKLENYDNAFKDAERATIISNASGRKEILVMSYLRLGELYFKQENYSKATEVLETAFEHSLNSNLMENQKDISVLLSKCYYFKSNFKDAYNYLQVSKYLSDSILNNENLRRINRMEYEFEFQKKEQEFVCEQEQDRQRIELLEKDIELKKKSQQIMWGLIIVAMIIIGLIVNNIFSRLKSKNLLAEKQAEINRKKLEELEKNQRLLAMKYLIEGQEKERQRIAQDLHDDLGGELSTIRVSLEAYNSEKEGLLKVAKEKVNSISDDVRRIAHNLMPSSLAKLGLYPAIEDLKENLQSAEQLNVGVFTLGLEKRFTPHIEVMLFRIIQEAVKNTIKHARAKNLEINLINDGENIDLNIIDDGKGFDISELKDSSGIGMKSIESRVKLLGGKIMIDSSVGKGTVISVVVPIDANAEESEIKKD